MKHTLKFAEGLAKFAGELVENWPQHGDDGQKRIAQAIASELGRWLPESDLEKVTIGKPNKDAIRRLSAKGVSKGSARVTPSLTTIATLIALQTLPDSGLVKVSLSDDCAAWLEKVAAPKAAEIPVAA